MKHQLINADCLDYLSNSDQSWTTIVADPPDNIGLAYDTYKDSLPDAEYLLFLEKCLSVFVCCARTVWFSFNVKWTFSMGRIAEGLIASNKGLEGKPCVQTYTFGQHSHHDLGGGHRPLWRLRWKDAPLLPDVIRVPSWRQEHGDKRADPRGRVPNDVFDFPRVTGNSKQRRPWHKTQLHEGLVERCIKLTTPSGGSVLDPFGGTGTTLRACKRTGNPCTLIELDSGYCARIAEEHGLKRSEYIHRAIWEAA